MIRSTGPLAWALHKIFAMDIKPDYICIYRDQNKEFRQYVGYMVATSREVGHYGEATAIAYRRLEDYFNGYNSEHRRLVISRPVFNRKIGNAWAVSLLLPHGIDLKTAPLPLDPLVEIRKIPPQKVAVLEYGISNTPDRIKAKELELLKWLGEQPDFAPVSNAQVVEHDSPYGLPFLSRNEILIDVRIV